MQKPANPLNEKSRIDTLRALNILDTSPQERFDRITRLAKKIFGVPTALITLVDSDRQWFLSAPDSEVKETPRDVSFCGHAILNDDVFTMPDARNDARFFDNPLVVGAPNVRFYAGCPISVQNGIKLGTICLIDQSPRIFSEEDKDLLRDLAHMVEHEIIAIQLATNDELTMVPNKRGFELFSKRALTLCKRMGCPASLMFIDLDKFKPINDAFGHAEGDRALQDFSSILKDTFRDSDIVGRIGGDEFAVFQVDCSAKACENNLKRLQKNVTTFNSQSSKNYNIEFSVGIVEYNNQRHESIHHMLADADNLMYKQKKIR